MQSAAGVMPNLVSVLMVSTTRTPQLLICLFSPGVKLINVFWVRTGFFPIRQTQHNVSDWRANTVKHTYYTQTFSTPLSNYRERNLPMTTKFHAHISTPPQTLTSTTYTTQHPHHFVVLHLTHPHICHVLCPYLYFCFRWYGFISRVSDSFCFPNQTNLIRSTWGSL